MKRKCIILTCFALLFAVAALMAGSKFLIPAYAMDEFATPTDLDDIDEPWPMNIISGEQIPPQNTANPERNLFPGCHLLAYF